MARIVGIDYGTKRTGIAVTDPLQIIASGLTTVPTAELFDFLQQYVSEEPVEGFVVGDPLYPDGNPAQIAPLVAAFVGQLKATFPAQYVVTWDERYTSEEAKKVILQTVPGKKKRSDKSLVDKISAAIILQDFMEHRR